MDCLTAPFFRKGGDKFVILNTILYMDVFPALKNHILFRMFLSKHFNR